METRKMTVHEALAKVKTADARIEKLLDGMFIDVCKKNADKIRGVKIDDYKTDMQSRLSKITDIINETNAIKGAISQSNARTEIMVGNKKMTVAEALYMWKYGIMIKQRILLEMREQYSGAMKSIDKNNGDQLDKKANDFAINIYASKDKVDPKDINELIQKFKDDNTWIMLDPNHLADRIKDLEDEIDEFTANVDGAIQMANATTIIEFEV